MKEQTMIDLTMVEEDTDVIVVDLCLDLDPHQDDLANVGILNQTAIMSIEDVGRVVGTEVQVDVVALVDIEVQVDVVVVPVDTDIVVDIIIIRTAPM